MHHHMHLLSSHWHCIPGIMLRQNLQSRHPKTRPCPGCPSIRKLVSSCRGLLVYRSGLQPSTLQLRHSSMQPALLLLGLCCSPIAFCRSWSDGRYSVVGSCVRSGPWHLDARSRLVSAAPVSKLYLFSAAGASLLPHTRPAPPHPHFCNRLRRPPLSLHSACPLPSEPPFQAGPLYFQICSFITTITTLSRTSYCAFSYPSPHPLILRHWPHNCHPAVDLRIADTPHLQTIAELLTAQLSELRLPARPKLSISPTLPGR